VFGLAKIYPVFDSIYTQAEYFYWENQWEQLEDICKKNNLNSVDKLISYYKDCPLS
jgi:hypothetical protein